MSEVIIPEQPEFPITKQDQLPAHTPDLAALLDAKLRSVKSEINCAQIGTIQSFDPATQTANVSLNFMRIVEKSVKQYPVLINIPVLVMQGGSGAITFPIAAGDPCLVLFCDRNIDSWVTSGLVSPPESERVHDLSDGIAVVGIRPLSSPISGYASNGVHSWHGTEKEAKLSLEASVKAQLEHKTARVTLIDEQEASLIQGSNGIKVEEKIDVHVGSATLKQALDSLCTALLNWVDTHNDTPNAATITAINNAKTLIDGILK